MKKIGIVTFHRPINYGAVLQSVALYKTISENGAKCEIIDYENESIRRAYKLFSLNRCTNIKLLIWNILNIPGNLKKKARFNEFLQKNVQLTKTVNKHTIEKFSDTYDCYITGSDQVWNYSCTGNDSVFFLDFVLDNSKKRSYAASVGDYKISDENKEAIRKYLSGFSTISVREKSSISIVESILGINGLCHQHLDPTLLVNRMDWEKMIANVSRLHKNNYILIYFMAQNDTIVRETMTLAQNIKRENDFDIVVIGGSLHKGKDGIFYFNAYSPEEFIALFRDASCVITNSFHGTAFSIIFNKDFYSYVKDVNRSGRVFDLLSAIGLQKRLFSSAKQIIKYEHIQFDKANELLQNWVNESIQYIIKIIEFGS